MSGGQVGGGVSLSVGRSFGDEGVSSWVRRSMADWATGASAVMVNHSAGYWWM